MPIRIVAVFLSTTFLGFSPARAQQTVTLEPADPKRWDAGVNFGWLGGDKSDVAEEWDDWYDTLATSIELGRYWTPRLKTEIGGTLTTEDSVYSSERADVPGFPSPVFISREHRYRVRAANALAAYQFLQNAWVHPFVAAGVHFAWERCRIEAPFEPPGRGPVVPPRGDMGTTFEARPLLSGGAKFYVGEQGFIRSDLSAAFDSRGATRVWWRVGGGLDF